jgi:hypothetical protein
MEPVILVVSAGLFAGLLMAVLRIRLPRRPHDGARADPFSDRPPGADVLNLASVRVAGVGGLGLVAMALVVAVAVPRIGETLALGFALGTVSAVPLILWRRRAGPLSSSGRNAGANTVLAIDDPISGCEPAPPDSPAMTTTPLPVKA